MIDKMNELYQQMLQNYEGGLSNTSTKKFDGIVASIASLLGIPEKDVYATGSGSRPGNLEVRLSQGVRATTHTIVGLGFIVDEKNDQENVAKLTNSALVTCKKFLGRGKAHYDNIVIFVESDARLFASGIICKKRTSITEKLIDELQIDNIVEVSPANNDGDVCDISYPLQTIFYGAPGTGKSYKTNEVAKKYNTIRTTFHPDSDYSTFVGAYKPTTIKSKSYGLNSIGETKPIIDPETGKTKEESKIEYRFVKQAFLKAYVQAWKFFCEAESVEDIEPQFLVIEEINRGNCAQIFGDLFQLLDRKDGFSEYPIEADEDISKSLTIKDSEKDPSFGEKGLQFTDAQKETINAVFNKDEDTPFRDIAGEIAIGKVLILPPNLYVWATMNTSDQSLFPIDSAFKRRWDWKYVKISNGYKIDKQTGKYIIEDGKKVPLGWKIETNGQDWWEFIQKINRIVSNMTSSADKQLGYFFCKANENNEIATDTFASKVLFYLWNDVFKDYGFDDPRLFKYKTTEGGNEVERDLTFPDFYDEDGKVIPDIVKQFVEHVMAWKGDDKKENN